MEQFQLQTEAINTLAVSPFMELGAYEALWDRGGTTFKRLSQLFAKTPDPRPSELVEPETAEKYARRAKEILSASGVDRYGIRVFGSGEYPRRLRDAEYPCQILYYQGWWELINSPISFAVVGTRNPSENGIARTKNIVRKLTDRGVTIFSGLAGGIDEVAHKTAIEHGGKTVAVLGTPLSKSYPKKNASLQKEIASNHLVISQVPIIRYENTTNPTNNRFFFPERNVTMSALTDATVIVEAGETSGTLTQARAAIKQGRKLFILESCFNDPKLTWPHRFLKQGAVRVRNMEDIWNEISAAKIHAD